MRFFLVFTFTFWLFAISADTLPPTRVTPVNVAEAVFAPFWDHEFKENRQWQVERGKFIYNFGTSGFAWDKAGSFDEPAFQMVRTNPVKCAGYDHLLATLKAPVGVKLRITLETDAGVKSHEWQCTSVYRDEYEMSLGGAGVIQKMTLEIFDNADNRVLQGAFHWFGLRNRASLDLLKQEYRQLAEQPLDVFLAPRETEPAFVPLVGLLARPAMMQKIQNDYRKNGKGPLLEAGDYEPEKQLRTYLNWSNQQIFGRIDNDDQKLRPSEHMLKAAIISRDADLMRLAVRNSIVLALTPYWDASFQVYFRDSGWEQRPFTHSAAAYDLALTLDLASDMLSDAGRELIARRLSTEALAMINHTVWKYQYIVNNNQMVVFSKGRIAAYLALEKVRGWNSNRIKPYTELAYDEFKETVDAILHADGSFLEGTAYFCYSIGNIVPVFQMYASARNLDIAAIMPEKLRATGLYTDVMVSTDRRGGLIPISSGQGMAISPPLEIVQSLSIAAPQSQWTRIYHTMMQKRDNQPIPSPVFYQQLRQVPKDIPPYKVFAELPEMGAAASVRVFKEQPVKILLLGAVANYHGHQHNDKGSFVLEYAGDTYAMDPGGQNYADADSRNVIQASWHNVLVPLNAAEKDAVHSKAAIRPEGTGNETTFRMSINPASSWPESYRKWLRTVDSPAPDRITIADEYELKSGDGVQFVWMTALPWKKESAQTIRLDGQDSYALITFPSGVEFKSETVTVRRTEKVSRLLFEKNGAAGKLAIEVRLFKKVNP